MKQFFDLLAVAILAVLIFIGIDIMATQIGLIPLAKWKVVGERFAWICGVIVGIWSFIRGSQVLERWYRRAREGTQLTNMVKPSNNLGTRE